MCITREVVTHVSMVVLTVKDWGVLDVVDSMDAVGVDGVDVVDVMDAVHVWM